MVQGTKIGLGLKLRQITGLGQERADSRHRIRAHGTWLPAFSLRSGPSRLDPRSMQRRAEKSEIEHSTALKQSLIDTGFQQLGTRH